MLNLQELWRNGTMQEIGATGINNFCHFSIVSRRDYHVTDSPYAKWKWLEINLCYVEKTER